MSSLVILYNVYTILILQTHPVQRGQSTHGRKESRNPPPPPPSWCALCTVCCVRTCATPYHTNHVSMLGMSSGRKITTKLTFEGYFIVFLGLKMAKSIQIFIRFDSTWFVQRQHPYSFLVDNPQSIVPLFTQLELLVFLGYMLLVPFCNHMLLVPF